jgi:hypothetical protein
VVTVPTTPDTTQASRLDTAAATSRGLASALDRLAMSGLFSSRAANPLESRDGMESLNLAALDRFFSEF